MRAPVLGTGRRVERENIEFGRFTAASSWASASAPAAVARSPRTAPQPSSSKYLRASGSACSQYWSGTRPLVTLGGGEPKMLSISFCQTTNRPGSPSSTTRLLSRGAGKVARHSHVDRRRSFRDAVIHIAAAIRPAVTSVSSRRRTSSHLSRRGALASVSSRSRKSRTNCRCRWRPCRRPSIVFAERSACRSEARICSISGVAAASARARRACSSSGIASCGAVAD